MNFLLSEEQNEMQRTVQRFCESELPATRLHEMFDAEDEHDAALWQGLAELGIFGIMVPEEYGGLHMELIDLAIVAEVLGRHAVPGPFLAHSLATLAIMLYGSDEQKQHWLPGLADGSLIGTVAFGEDKAAWLPEQWQMAAGVALSGEKRFVPAATHADLIVVGLSGGKLAVVERKTAAGLEVVAQDVIDRTRRCGMLKFNGTPAQPLPENTDNAARLRDAALVLLAADAFGGADRCVAMAMDYAKVREQYGVQIGQFQALKHQLVNMAIEVEPARGLYWYAAHAWDHIREQAPRSAALAKAHLAERYMQAARDTVEAHGGIGYTWECDVQIFFKRAMFDHAWLGQPHGHLARAADFAGW
jgi:alkylation response protein AidB-like acyl-CoA dehydrogenase